MSEDHEVFAEREEQIGKILLWISAISFIALIAYTYIIGSVFHEVPANDYLHVRKTCYKMNSEEIIICALKPTGESGQLEYCPINKDDL